MNISNDMQKKLQELHALEHQTQVFLNQKQTSQIGLNEINNALNEIVKTKNKVFKTISGIMIEAEKNSLIKELNEKKRILEIRINSIEKQEELLEKKALELKEEIKKVVEKDNGKT